MSDSKSALKTVVASVLVIGIVIGASCSKSPEEKAKTPPKSVETLFVVEVNNFEFTISQMDQYLKGIMPIPMGMQALLRMQLGGILGDPQLTGVNMGGNLRVVGVLLSDDSGQAKPLSRMLIAGWLPVSDYDKLVGANPKFSKPDENGISELTVSLGMPGMPTNPNAAPSGPAMLITKLNNEHALVSSKDQYDNLVAYMKTFSADKSADPFAGIAAKSDYPISIYGDVQTASKAFGPLVMKKIDELKETFSEISAVAQADAPGMMADPNMMGGIIEMYVSLLETLMNEVKSFTVAIKPTPDVLFIKETIAAVPGTDTAAMLVADPQASEKNELLGYLENGATMNFAMKMNKPFWKKLSIAGMDLMGTMFGQNISAEDMATIKKLINDSMDAMGESFAGTFSVDAEGKSMFDMNYVIEVADADKFNKMLDESMPLLETTGILDFYQDMGIEMDYTIKRNTDTYKGVSIDSAKLVMKSTEPNSPMGQMIDKMYGGGFDYRWGIVDKLCAVAIGGNVDAEVRKLIDLAKAGGPKEVCSEVKDALKMLPQAEKADFFVTYNFVRLQKMMGGMMPMGPGMTMPEINVPSKSNINIAGTIANSKAVIDIALPKQHVTEIVTAFMMLQQKMMKQQAVPTTKAKLNALETAVEMFYVDNGRYPTAEEGLMALSHKPANANKWNGPYVKNHEAKDAWNRDFIYKLDATGKIFEIISYGADGKPGGEGLNKDLFSTD